MKPIRRLVAVVAAVTVACGGSDASLQAFCEAWAAYTQQGDHAHQDGAQDGGHEHDAQVVLLANAPEEISHDVGLVVAAEHRPHTDAGQARQRIADYTSRNCR